MDLDQYRRSGRRVENFRVLQTGGAKRRGGTRFVAEELGPMLLVRWEFSRTDAYILSFTELKLRVYRNGGRVEFPAGTPVTIDTPYRYTDLRELDWEQSGDVLLLTHPAHPLQRLERLSNEIWRMREQVFDVAPSFEYGLRTGVITLTPGATTGTGIVMTASAPLFMASDGARELDVVAGVSIGARAMITAFTDSTHVVATITEPFASTAAIPGGNWRLGRFDSPQTTITLGAKDPVGAITTLTLGLDGFRPGDVGKFVHALDGTFQIGSITSPLVAQATIRSEATGVGPVPAGAWELEEDAFSVTNGYANTITFMGDRLILIKDDHVYASKPGDYFNFATGALDDDALSVALRTQPIAWARGGRRLLIGTMGGEVVVDPGDNAVLTPDNFPFAKRTDYGSTEFIRPVSVGNVTLFVDRSQREVRELVFNFQVDDYVAPNLVLLASHMTKPIRINGIRMPRVLTGMVYQRTPDSTLWALRSDGTMLGLTYLREQNIVGWHRHWTGTPRIGPDGHRYPVLNDGGIEAAAIIPHPAGDREQLWLGVRRTIGGVVKHYVEYVDDEGTVYDQINVDSALVYDGRQAATLTPAAVSGDAVLFTASLPIFTPASVGTELRHLSTPARARIIAYTSPTQVTGKITVAFPSTAPLNPAADDGAGAWGIGAFTFTGLGHLEGKEVEIVGDGAVYPPVVVTGGQVTIAHAAVQAEIGLDYDSVFQNNRPEVEQIGTAQTLVQRIAEVRVRLHETMGAVVNGTPYPFRKPTDPMGQALPLFSDDIKMEQLDDETGPFVTIEQNLPLPMTILLVTSLVNIED